MEGDEAELEFEFDPAKSDSNQQKHGIDFIESQELWKDEKAFVIEARSDEETRYFLFARLNETHWTVIFTLRNQKIRIISARRSRDEEKQIYQGR